MRYECGHAFACTLRVVACTTRMASIIAWTECVAHVDSGQITLRYDWKVEGFTRQFGQMQLETGVRMSSAAMSAMPMSTGSSSAAAADASNTRPGVVCRRHEATDGEVGTKFASRGGRSRASPTFPIILAVNQPICKSPTNTPHLRRGSMLHLAASQKSHRPRDTTVVARSSIRGGEYPGWWAAMQAVPGSVASRGAGDVVITRSARLNVDGAGLDVARRMRCGTLCAV